jgi:Ca2+-binding RTX toxin-like protein
VDFSGVSEGIQLASDVFMEPGALFLQNTVTYGTEQTYRNVEAIIATGFDDFVILTETEVDFLDLGAGNDLAVTSDLDERIDGGEGDDVIFGGFGDDTVTLGAGADIFGVTRFSTGMFPFGDGNDVILDFDAAQDILYFQIENATTYDPLADTTQTAMGALISYVDGSSILLAGVDMADLSAANFIFEDAIYTFMA